MTVHSTSGRVASDPVVFLHRATSSKLHELVACAYSVRPDVEVLPEGDLHPNALVGNAIDDLVTAYVTGATLSPPDAAKARGADADEVGLRWAQLLPWLEATTNDGSWATQLGLVYNADTDTVHLRETRRRRTLFETTCIIDLARQTGPDEVEVVDVKCGQSKYTHPEQLLTNALAAARHYGVRNVRASFLFVQPHGLQPQVDRYDALRLAAWRYELRAHLESIPDAEPTPGAQCRWCRVAQCQPGDDERKRMGWKRR